MGRRHVHKFEYGEIPGLSVVNQFGQLAYYVAGLRCRCGLVRMCEFDDRCRRLAGGMASWNDRIDVPVCAQHWELEGGDAFGASPTGGAYHMAEAYAHLQLAARTTTNYGSDHPIGKLARMLLDVLTVSGVHDGMHAYLRDLRLGRSERSQGLTMAIDVPAGLMNAVGSEAARRTADRLRLEAENREALQRADERNAERKAERDKQAVREAAERRIRTVKDSSDLESGLDE